MVGFCLLSFGGLVGVCDTSYSIFLFCNPSSMRGRLQMLTARSRCCPTCGRKRVDLIGPRCGLLLCRFTKILPLLLKVLDCTTSQKVALVMIFSTCEIDARLSQTHVQGGVFVKTHLSWSRACLQSLRFAPRLAIFHACWQSFTNRLHAKGEANVCEYLCNNYTQSLPDRFAAVGHDPESWFASFWCGYEGVLPGTGCGSEPSEALHKRPTAPAQAAANLAHRPRQSPDKAVGS